MRSDPYDLPEWERKYERELLPQRQWLANELGGGRTMSTVWLLLTLFWMVQEGVIEVNVLVCQDANRSFLITCATFDVIAMLIGVFLKWYWDRRLKWTFGVRVAVPLVIAFIISSGLVAWNPVKDQALEACLASEEFSRYIIMSHVAAIPRGLVLGGVISGALYFLVLTVLSLFTGRKR
ncbi:MAG: hypothetical protein QXU75_03330 [Candidatus Methanomethylicaceae archaeon]